MANGTIAFDTLSTSGQISGTAKSIDTDYLLYGSAKVRYNFELDSSDNGFEGAFNCSSGADNGPGDATVTFTNAMSNQNYTPTSSTADGDICGTQADRTDGNASRQTTNFKTRIRDNGNTSRDGIAYVALFGDLA